MGMRELGHSIRFENFQDWEYGTESRRTRFKSLHSWLYMPDRLYLVKSVKNDLQSLPKIDISYWKGERHVHE